MLLRLDPRYPIVWRSPTSLQIGAEQPIARLDSISPAVEHLLGAVLAGISRRELDELADRVGAGTDEVRNFVDRIAPALVRPSPRRDVPRWVVDGAGRTADGIRWLLTGDRSVDAFSTDPPGLPDIAVLVASHVIDPRRYVRWLSLDIPHLAVTYTDVGVEIGPFVEPGVGPCLHCLALERTDADPAWPAMASQLLAQRSLAETEPLIGEVCARVARIATARLDDGTNDLVFSSLRIDGFRVTGTLIAHRRHPDCGCRSLSGNETVPGAVGIGSTVQPTTGTAVIARE
ncbi:bacteriocin biosynthesis cyclodehydratase domain-containing protein [Mycetocola sp. CAN_C7]